MLLERRVEEGFTLLPHPWGGELTTAAAQEDFTEKWKVPSCVPGFCQIPDLNLSVYRLSAYWHRSSPVFYLWPMTRIQNSKSSRDPIRHRPTLLPQRRASWYGIILSQKRILLWLTAKKLWPDYLCSVSTSVPCWWTAINRSWWALCLWRGKIPFQMYSRRERELFQYDWGDPLTTVCCVKPRLHSLSCFFPFSLASVCEKGSLPFMALWIFLSPSRQLWASHLFSPSNCADCFLNPLINFLVVQNNLVLI